LKYRDYGSRGLKVSALGFGAMRLPMKDGHVMMDEAVELLRRGMELGINYIDTAVGYCGGESEIAVGRAVKGRREKVYLSTKNHYRGTSGAEWRSYLDSSLKKLDVDYIDFYHFHGITWQVFDEALRVPGGPLDEMKKVRAEGLVKYICFSFHDKPENLIKLIDTGEFDGMTVQYNLLDRSNEEGIAYAHSKGLGVAIMGPVGGGRLVGYSEVIRGMIPGGVKTTPEAALRFVLSNPGVSVALSGMTNLKELEENVATASRSDPLGEEERRRISEMLEENRKLADLYCTGCNYCMPCPNGVDIPKNFQLMNYHRLYGLTEYARDQYRKLAEEGKHAGACVECGECEPKCPQKIPVIDQLKETDRALGG